MIRKDRKLLFIGQLFGDVVKKCGCTEQIQRLAVISIEQETDPESHILNGKDVFHSFFRKDR
jgi:hypothetical protein